MSEEIFVKCASPTLAGIKTGNLFSCPMESKEDTLESIRCLNRKLLEKGLSIVPLRFERDRVLIYMFRPDFLKRDLKEAEAAALLKEAGYDSDSFAGCLTELAHRLNTAESFPHEIGLFLSYPPEDVRGFIENRAANFKCVGCWKVYGDEQAAKKRFDAYERCTKNYCRQWKNGKSVTQLAVAV